MIKAFWDANTFRYAGLSMRGLKKGQIKLRSPSNESWILTNIDSIGIVKVGSTPARKERKYWGGDINWVSSGEVANNNIVSTKEKISQVALRNTSLYVCPVGTVLIAMIGQGKTRGQSSILKIDAATNQNVAAVIIDHGCINPTYLWYFFLSKYMETRAAASGGNQPALNSVKVGEFFFPLPPLAEQTAIVERADRLLAMVDELEMQVAERKGQAEELMQVVLREAFEGK